jgi:hypothetical protein
MDRIFNILKFAVLAMFSGIFYVLMEESVSRNLLGFVILSSIFFAAISCMAPEDRDIREHDINRIIGKE